MRYYSLNVMSRDFADMFSRYLKLNKIAYERSGCGVGYHFEVLLSPVGLKAVNSWLDLNYIE